MSGERVNIGEIRKVLEANWITRRVLKRAEVPNPTRAQLETWSADPPAWLQREKAKRAKRAAERAKRAAELVAVTCPGCGFSIRVRPTIARSAKNWDGLYCDRRACDWEPPTAEGMATVISRNAVGSFTGWKHTFPDDEQIAAIERARRLAAAATAMAPESAAQAVLRALVAPAGFGHHLVTLNNGWSTAVTLDAESDLDVENPMVAAELHRMAEDGDNCGVTVRTFTDEISHTLPNGVDIPVKEVRGWYLSGGVFQPFDEQAIFAAYCTDAKTGEPIPPERDVRYADAHPVIIE